MVVSKQSYEDLRNQRMEENKRRMEELRLPQLTKALKPPQIKRTQPCKIGTEMVEVRRSNRVAYLPARVYKPELIYKKITQDSSRKSSRTRSPAMTKAVEVRLSLGMEHPSCIMMLKRRHAVTTCSHSMYFPLWFWKSFLPKVDSEMVIEDENGEIDHVQYYAKSKWLTVGWKKFVVGHNLLDGDVLVLHLVEPYKFKVYIVRANDLKKADVLITRLNLEARMKHMTTETDMLSPTPKKTKREKPLSSTMASSQIISLSMEQVGNDSEALGSEVLEGSRLSKPDVPSQELKAFKDFHIMVKGVCIDTELPDDVRMNYFKLCMDRKEFLHDSLPENFYYKLAAGMIGETVNIANEINNSKPTTTKEELDAWDNSLKSFAQLGMKVGFLRDKIATLSTLMFESENRLEIERYVEAKTEHKDVEDEIKRLTEVLKKLNESSSKIQGIVDDLKEKAGRYEVKFQEEVDNSFIYSR